MKLTKITTLLAAALTLMSAAPAKKTTVFMIGDSTMANKSLDGQNQERGWGHMMPGFFSEDVVVRNYAKNGRSSKSFISEGIWDEVLNAMDNGDYLIIQFGHNDEKADTARNTDPGTTYDDNIRRFIQGARSKGATPIVCNSIVRRTFGSNPDAVAQDDVRSDKLTASDEGDRLEETHGEYLTAAKRVAEQEGVTFIDMNKLTHDVVENMGPEHSKEIYMWIDEGKCPACPKGRQDNTHLNVKGGRLVASMAAQQIKEKVPSLAPYIRFYDFVVAQDGSGDYFTLQEAISNVPDYSKKHRTTILIRKGVYKEKVVIPESKMNITLIGEDGATLTWDDYAAKPNRFGDETSTSGSATFYVYAPGFVAEGVTFQNTAGRVGQAVACFVSGQNAVFRRCRFLGNQDTLYTYGENSVQYYDNCYIEGTVDFIFGKATAIFNACEIRSIGNGYVCAPATPQGKKHGYVFLNCNLTKGGDANKVHLARPWRPYAKAVFVDCHMDDHIAPEGWNDWGKKENQKTAFFSEIGSTGPGSNAQARAKWTKKIKNKNDYTVEKLLNAAN